MTKEIYDKATELLNHMAYYAGEILKYKRRKFFSSEGLDKSVIELLGEKDDQEEKYLRLFEEAYEEKQKEFEAL